MASSQLLFESGLNHIFLTELIERGTGHALARFSKQFVSFSPMFEVFSTQIYTHSILNNLTFGGTRYIATGRGFATSRISFSVLFSRFAGPSICLGMLRAVWCSHGHYCTHTWHDWHDWILQVFRKSSHTFLRNFV